MTDITIPASLTINSDLLSPASGVPMSGAASLAFDAGALVITSLTGARYRFQGP